MEYNIKVMKPSLDLLVLFRVPEIENGDKGDHGSHIEFIFTHNEDGRIDEDDGPYYVTELTCGTPFVPEINEALKTLAEELDDNDFSTVDELQEFCEKVADKRNEYIFSYKYSNL